MSAPHVRRRLLFTGVICLCLLAVPAMAVGDGGWTWPIDPPPRVVRGFEPPSSAYSAGHRGVDLGAAAGVAVRSVAPGTVRFAGSVAGTEVVTIDHGTERSTYQPVAATVRAGQRVGAGEVIGRLLLTGTHCGLDACLHLGRKVADAYADPLGQLAAAPAIRLVSPMGPPPVPQVESVGNGQGEGRLTAPVQGPVTSPFGMRQHPITGILKLHDGTDFGVPCGTPVHAAGSGTASRVYFDRAYGNRVLIEHVDSDGTTFSTSYNHLSATSVHAGERVDAGQVVGRVGTTGLSTGCHLHFMVVVDGGPVDPMPRL